MVPSLHEQGDQGSPGQSSASVRAGGARQSPPGAAAVLEDLEAGHEPLTFARATHEKCLWVKGRAPNVRMLHRAAKPTRPFPLESAIVGSVRVTTRPALFRWLARRNQVAPSEVVRKQEERERQRSEGVAAKLDALGIR
jgi:hypothetical protein